MTSPLRSAVALLLTAMGPSAVVAQGKAPTHDTAATPGYTLQTSARLVVVDVNVTTADGSSVNDLSKADFHVSEAGQPQIILSFDRAASHIPLPTQQIESTADLDRLAPQSPVNVLVLDEVNTHFKDMAFAQWSVHRFVEAQGDKLVVPTMLVAVNLKTFTVLSDYTQSRQKLLDALDHHVSIYPWQLEISGWTFERTTAAFLTLRRLAGALEGHPGHKNMIWIGRGLPDILHPGAKDSEALENAMEDSANKLRDARVTLTSIDPEGIRGGMPVPDVNPGNDALVFDNPFSGVSFARIARLSGGRAIFGRNDVDVQVGNAANMAVSAYTISYRPISSSTAKKELRKISVTVDRPRVRVESRRGYYVNDDAPFDAQRNHVLEQADMASAMTDKLVYDAVVLTGRATAEPNSFVIHVPSQSLRWSDASDSAPRATDVEVVVATFDKNDKPLFRQARTMHADAPATVIASGSLNRSLELPVAFAASPAAVRARVVVRVPSTGRLGTLDIALQEPVVASK